MAIGVCVRMPMGAVAWAGDPVSEEAGSVYRHPACVGDWPGRA